MCIENLTRTISFHESPAPWLGCNAEQDGCRGLVELTQATAFDTYAKLNLLLFAELARLLQAIKLRLYVWIYSSGFEKSVFRDGSRTGILEGWSYDPGEALRAIQCASPRLSAPFFLQVVNFDRLVYLRRSVQVRTILRHQNVQSLLAHCVVRIQAGWGIADENGRPQAQRIRLEIAVASIEDVVLPSIGQGWTQGTSIGLGKNIGAEKIGGVHGLYTCSIFSKGVWIHHAKDVVVKGIALMVEPTSGRKYPDIATIRIGVGVVNGRTRGHVVCRARAVDATQDVRRVDAVLGIEGVREIKRWRPHNLGALRAHPARR